MSAGEDRERRRRALEAAADELFDALYPEDLAALVAKYNSRPELRAAAVDRAEKVADKLATTDAPVTPDEYVLLIAACLTWGKNQAGVALVTTHALKKFLRYRRFAALPVGLPMALPVGILVRTDRIVPDDDQVIGLLARSLRIRSGVTDARPVGEPELILNIVVPAIVAALAPGPDQPPDPAADAALVSTALDVLERGAVLAAEYRAARRPVPGVSDLPVAGNADFLVRIAAYRLAIEQRRGLVATRLLDGLQEAVAELTSILRKAMTRSVGFWRRHGADEPDVAAAINQYAGYLGSAAGNATARRAVCTVHCVLSHRLRLDEPPDKGPFDGPGDGPPSPPGGAEHAARLSDVEHLVGWLIAALFQGADKRTQEALLEWLNGKLEWLNGTEVTDRQKHLPLLVRRLRVATTVLDQAPAWRSPRPAGVTPSQFDALAARLAATVDPDEIRGTERADARRLTLAALPPLWTRRWPVIQLLAAHLRSEKGLEPRKAMLVAAHGVRAPVQFVQPSTSPLPVPCCPDAGIASRSAAGGRPREPAPYQEICPHRPWGEIGWVENYRTLGDAAGLTAEAARRQLERYQGPWPELLWK